MQAQIPQVEIVTPSHQAPYPKPVISRSHRVGIFFAVFLLVMLIGQAINFSRAPVYRSSATVLTVAPPAVDQNAVESDLDLQHVAIQRQILLGRELLDQTLAQLRQSLLTEQTAITSLADFQSMLSVTPVPSTHLVELSAEGDKPALLMQMVNTWIESYLRYRERAIKEDVGDTLDILHSEYAELNLTLDKKRSELQVFRDQHEILSEGRSDNRAHAKLQSLNKAMSNAREDFVHARADLVGIESAIERGEPVIPDSEQRTLSELQTQAELLRSRLSDYESRYTSEYKTVEPKFMSLPNELAMLERTIKNRIRAGQRALLLEKRRAVQAAQDRVTDLDQQLRAHKQEAAAFTAAFTEHQSHVKDLEGLEDVHRATEQRLAQIEAKSLEKYPQVKVVDWAYQPEHPLRPNYLRDALMILAGALGLALMSVWLVEYLRRPDEATASHPPMSGIRVYSDPKVELATAHHSGPEMTQQPNASMLAAPLPRELTEPEMTALWQITDPSARRMLALLLSGASVDEAAGIRDKQFDAINGRLHILQPAPRSLSIPSAFATLFDTEESSSTPFDSESMDAGIKLLAYDAGLPYPEEVNAETVRHTYVLYLVRQGVRLGELTQVIGPVSPSQLAAYGPYSPKGSGKPLQDVELTYRLGQLA